MGEEGRPRTRPPDFSEVNEDARRTNRRTDYLPPTPQGSPIRRRPPRPGPPHPVRRRRPSFSLFYYSPLFLFLSFLFSLSLHETEAPRRGFAQLQGRLREGPVPYTAPFTIPTRHSGTAHPVQTPVTPLPVLLRRRVVLGDSSEGRVGKVPLVPPCVPVASSGPTRIPLLPTDSEENWVTHLDVVREG